MDSAWRSWCGLCGAIPRDVSVFPDLCEEKELLDVAVRCFSLDVSCATIPVSLYT